MFLADQDSNFVNVFKINIHYKCFGKYTFLLVHGFGARAFSFDSVMEFMPNLGGLLLLIYQALGFLKASK
jgi:pimeloyl-ACP methyl ester carboxylesterase